MFAKGDFEAQLLGGDGGRIGGRSRSPKKQAAARKNGRLGGRKPTRTLAAKLLNRWNLTDAQVERLTEACKLHMHFGDFHTLTKFFRVPRLLSGDDDTFKQLNTTEWHKPRGKVSVNVRRAIALLRAVARFVLTSK